MQNNINMYVKKQFHHLSYFFIFYNFLLCKFKYFSVILLSCSILLLLWIYYPALMFNDKSLNHKNPIYLENMTNFLTPRSIYYDAKFYERLNGLVNDVNVSLLQQLTTEMIQSEFGFINMRDFRMKFVPEEGGNPIRIVIISTWRSGSSFFSGLFSSVPGTLMHFETLIYLFTEKMTNSRIRGPPIDKEAINLIKKFLLCQHNTLPPNVKDSIQMQPLMFAPHFGIKAYDKQECKSLEFMTAVCKIAPFQVMKLVRLTLALAEQLLQDNKLNIKLIYLVRDPRAIYNSRNSPGSNADYWCSKNPDCFDPRLLCYDMENDYETAIRLHKNYYDRFRIVRYEDLLMHLESKTKELLNFVGLKFNPNVANFINQKIKPGNFVFHWQHQITYYKVMEIQSICYKAIQVWGYKTITNKANMINGSYLPVDLNYKFETSN